MKSKNTSCYFQHKFSIFNACEKYLTLPPLQLVLEAYLIRSLAKSAALSFWSSVLFILLVTTLFIVFQSKLNIRFHWIKSIYRLVYNILGFIQKKSLPLVFFYHYLESVRLFYQTAIFVEVVRHQTLTLNDFCLVQLGFLIYVF